MLAAMSTHAKQLETAEVAYAAINEADKVILWQSKDFEKGHLSFETVCCDSLNLIKGSVLKRRRQLRGY
jgi:hypothetical protein